MPIYDEWLEATNPMPGSTDFWHCSERPGGRERVADALRQTVLDHLVGAETLARIGFPETAARLVELRVPSSARQRSGDLGEILATEYIDECTQFGVPVRRLRWKGDRDLPMPGDDVIGLTPGDTPRLIKCEAKSRQDMRRPTVESASNALNRGNGRPKPETLAFLAVRLHELDQEADAGAVEAFLDEVGDDRLEHLLFSVSGNDATMSLQDHLTSDRPLIRRHVVGVVLDDHQGFIRGLFDGLNA